MFVKNWARIVAYQGLKDQSEDLAKDYYSIASVSKSDQDCWVDSKQVSTLVFLFRGALSLHHSKSSFTFSYYLHFLSNLSRHGGHEKDGLAWNIEGCSC